MCQNCDRGSSVYEQCPQFTLCSGLCALTDPVDTVDFYVHNFNVAQSWMKNSMCQ